MANADPEDPSADGDITFEPAGLLLFAPPRRNCYWCTPVNSITFATTGGDGTHFGWLDIRGLAPDFAPIVMSVPMSDSPNLLVGANMREFLSLGCKFGYF